MTTTAHRGSSGVLRWERVAGGMLPRVLGTPDMVAIFVAIVLLVTSSATIQAAGPVAFWLVGAGCDRFFAPGCGGDRAAWRDVSPRGIYLFVDA